MNGRDRQPLRGLALVGMVVVAVVAMLGVAVASPVEHAGRPAMDFEVSAVSTQADTVTGGDVLVRIAVPRTVPLHQVQVSVDGRDVTDAFRPGEQPRTLLGLVDGLAVGSNTLEVTADGQGRGRPSARLELVNHPVTGPVFSGPHQEPFICETEVWGLGSPLDENCGAETKVEYFYRSSETNEFGPYDPAAPPDDVARTTTTEGSTVDYVVRVETGTINRGVYRIAFLHQPGTALPDPWTNTPGWNNRLVYTFGWSCNAGYHQGRSTGPLLDDSLLGPGFAVATSTQTDFATRCNDVTSAETAMMVKEHFIEQFGLDRHTIGYGCSGGAMQQHQIVQNYPGILDGIIPECSWPDIVTLVGWISDCALLGNAFATTSETWTEGQKTAVSGFADWNICPSRWSAGNIGGVGFDLAWIVPQSCDSAIPDELVYDPDNNPDGVRCTLQDDWVNIYGTDPETGFAPRPLDNVGVQYGLEAFNDGAITFEQFVQLNERVGGFDVDGNLVDHRTVADPDALDRAYATGRVLTGGGGLTDVPIIDVRRYGDLVLDIHDYVRSFSTRARLIAANGHADNHVIWTAEAPGARAEPQAARAVLVIDEWLTNIATDTSDADLAQKVVDNKPADAVDSCWTPEGDRIAEPLRYDGEGQCNELYPPHADPRMIAGASVAGDVLKCALAPVDPADYSQSLTAEQVERLHTVFPAGTCDYQRPGIGQQPLAGTWLWY